MSTLFVITCNILLWHFEGFIKTNILQKLQLRPLVNFRFFTAY